MSGFLDGALPNPTLDGSLVNGGGAGDADLKREGDEEGMERADQVTTIGKFTEFQSTRAPGQKFNKAALGLQGVPASQIESNMDEESRGVTQMHDILIELGLHDAPSAVREPVAIFTTSKQQQLKLNLNQLSNTQLEEYVETNQDEENAIEEIRRKRIEQLEARRKAEKHGSVYELDIKQFNEEITLPSFEGFVIMLIYIYNSEACDVMRNILETIAQRHRAVKCTQVIASRAIEGFDDKDCPCILTYRNGGKVSQYNTLAAFNKFKTDADCVEWVLAQDGILQTELSGDPRIYKTNPRRIHTQSHTASSSSLVSPIASSNDNVIRTLLSPQQKFQELDSDDFDSD